MKDDITRKIAHLTSRQEPLSESEVSHLMTLCRKAMEHMPLEERRRYPILSFFCNWALHITIDRSLEGMAMLKRLNDTLVDLKEAHTDRIIERVTELISFRQLRREMVTLFGHINAPAGTVEDQPRWENFLRHFIEIIRDCSLEVGDPDSMSRRTRELFETIKANPVKDGCWVTGVSVVEVDYGLLQGRDSHRILCIHVLMSDTTHMVIPMHAHEVFGPPAGTPATT